MEPIEDIQRRAARGDSQAQVLLAERLDAAGDHAMATEWLQRAQRLGDTQAMARLGIRWLRGKEVRHQPQLGVPILARASDAGNAEASEVIAVLAATGNGTPQSWPLAMDYLKRAQSQGSDRAAALLKLLPGDPAGFAALAEAPPPRMLSEAPRIGVIDGFLNDEECDWLAGRAEGRLAPAMVYGAEGEETQVVDARTNRAAPFNLVDLDPLFVAVQVRICRALKVAYPQLEQPSILHYAPGQRFEPHYDFIDPTLPVQAADLAANGQRIATLLVYLNDGYQGGTTDFPELGIAHKGAKGQALFFWNVNEEGRPDRKTFHAGRPTESGEKVLLSQWVRAEIRGHNT